MFRLPLQNIIPMNLHIQPYNFLNSAIHPSRNLFLQSPPRMHNNVVVSAQNDIRTGSMFNAPSWAHERLSTRKRCPTT